MLSSSANVWRVKTGNLFVESLSRVGQGDDLENKNDDENREAETWMDERNIFIDHVAEYQFGGTEEKFSNFEVEVEALKDEVSTEKRC